jgi:hypothetical protein
LYVLTFIVVSLVLNLVDGYRVALKGDEHMKQASRIMHKLSRDAQPGAWFVDLFPVMKNIPDWVPGTYFKQYARQTRQELDNWVTSPWELIKKQKVTTSQIILPCVSLMDLRKVKQTSFSSRLMDKFPDMTPDDEDLIIWSAASIYSAGSDTVSTSYRIVLNVSLTE